MGAHLIRCLQEKAKESGVERIVLEARVTNEAAISLYQKMGVCKPWNQKKSI